MNQLAAIRQLINYQRIAFETAFTAWVMAQERANFFTGAFCYQAHWLPEGIRRQYIYWLNAYGKGVDDFKHAVDEGFNFLEGLCQFNDVDK